MQFIDLKTQQRRIRQDVEKRILNVLDHGRYIMGPEVKELEEQLADYVGVKHCITCSSGTDALLMPLMAWNIGPGDAVFVPTFTFIATAEMVQLLGATPVFVDIEKDTFNMDPLELEKKVSQIVQEGNLNPRAVIPVDLFGLPANYPEIQKIAEKYNLLVLEDGAQGFGGKIDNQKVCSFGEAATTLFFPAKPLGGYGDGGAVFTNNDELAEKLESIRVHGKGSDKYDNIRVGINGRMDSMQAAIVLSKLTIFDDELVRREKWARAYSDKLAPTFQLQKIPATYASAWAQYSLITKGKNHRDDMMIKLKSHGIPTMIYYPIPLHLQTTFKHLNNGVGDYPVSEDTADCIFSIPMHPYLDDEMINQIVSGLLD